MALNRNWRLWCRLCAEENLNDSINIFLKHEHPSSTHPTGNSSNETPGTVAIEIIKFFLVNMASDDDLPQCICSDCNSLIESLVDFSIRVSKVQKMFTMLQNSFDAEKTDFNDVRLKFGITNIDNTKNSTVSEVILVHEKPKIHSESEPESQEHESLVKKNPLSSKIDIHIKSEEESDDENMEYEEIMRVDDDDEEFKPNDPIQTDVDDDDMASTTESLTSKKKNFKKHQIESHINNIHKKENSFNCEECGYTARTSGTLKSHLLTHSDYAPFTCDLCNKSYKTEYQMKRHRKNHDLKEHVCGACGLHLNSRTLLSRHLLTHSTDKDKVEVQKTIYTCEICNSIFRQSIHFESHMKRIHQQDVQIDEDKKILDCLFCEKKFKDKWLLRSHNRIHENEKPFVCEECGFSVRTYGNLKKHMLTHTDYAPFECDVCKKCFKSENRLQCHKEIHDPNKHVCVKCGLQLNTRTLLNRHLLTHFTDKDKVEVRKTIYTCEICNSIFRHSNHFESHMKRVHQQDVQIDEDKKIVQCTLCEKKFKSKWFLETHVKSVHKTERPFICEECGFTARTSSTLKQHMLTHTDYAPFECEVCKKCFKADYHLRRHKDIHDPNKHICSECGLQLNSRHTLNRHLLIHSDKMEHKCDCCGREFKRIQTLKNHLLLHTGLKPYACDFCDRTFANGSNCRTHKKRSHPVELAAQEASGEKSCTQNIPKLAALKAITKNKDNLTPVVSKQSVNFAFGKKQKPVEKNLNTN